MYSQQLSMAIEQYNVIVRVLLKGCQYSQGRYGGILIKGGLWDNIY